jgi:anaerobic selenocysteine-containing dehydrogenase
VAEFNNYQLSEMGLTFDDLKDKGYLAAPIEYKKYEKSGFFTPSGKVELYSSILEKHGYDPLPNYIENQESLVRTPELLGEYPFILITGGRQIGYFHSEGRQITSLRRMCPEPLVEINSETAVKLGIKDGDWVYIETPRGKGRVKQKARLTNSLQPQVVHAQHHWWLPERPGPDHGLWEHNINVIIPNDPPYDPVFGSTPLRGLLCKVYKV